MIQQLGSIGKRTALALFCAAVLASGCRSNVRGVYHVPIPAVDSTTQLNAREHKLIEELQQKAPLPTQLTPPEELAAMARAELIAGRLWDAGVLMSMASHRYYTLARSVRNELYDDGFDRASSNMFGLDRGLYNQLVAAEVKLLLELDFSEQVGRMSALLGVPLDPASVREDLVRVALGNIRNRHQADAAVTQRIEHLKQPPAEQLQRPRLAQAWIAHLQRAIEDDPYPAWATRALARTPLAAAWQAALGSVRSYVFYDVVLAAALLYARSPEIVVGALGSPRPETRANAAIALGTIESLGTLPALETALGREADPRTQLALHYALARLGEPNHLEQLVHAMASPEIEVRGQALLLGQWLREDLKRRVPEGPYVRAIHDQEIPEGLREVCVMMLGNLGALRPLGEPTINALLQAALEGSDGDSFRDVVGDAFAQIDQLDRSRVLGALRAGTPPVRPWLHRLAEITEPQDLELLARLMASSDREHTAKREDIVQVAGKIPGDAAQDLLQRWYLQDKKLRPVIAFTLILREDVDKEQLWQLAQATKDVYSLALRMPLAREDIEPVLRTFLKSKNLEDRAFAARAIGLFGTREHASLLGATLHYADDRSYPVEVVLRHLAVASLLDIELNMRRSQASNEAEPPPSLKPEQPPAAPSPLPPAVPLEPIPPPSS